MKKKQCIHCGSTHLHSHGHRWHCTQCGKTFVKNPQRERTGIQSDSREEYLQKWHKENKESRIAQYLERNKKTREEYEDNISVDYDYGRLRSHIVKTGLPYSNLAEEIKIKAPTLSKLMNHPPQTMKIKTLRRFETFFKEKFRL